MSQPFISYITRFKKIKKSILLLFSSLIIIDITFILRGQYKYTFFTNILLFVITNLSLSWAALLLGFPYKNLFLQSLARCQIFLLQIKYFPLKFLIMHLLLLGVNIFGSVRFLSKKITKIKFWKTKKFKPDPNRNRVKPTGFGSVRFGFFNRKTGKPVYCFTNTRYIYI